MARLPAAALAVAGSASADVPRYQTQSATLTANVLNGAYVHTYAITINPCAGSFTGTGGIASLGLTEAVGGTLAGTMLDFAATYQGAWAPYAWSYSGPLSGGTGHGPNGQTFGVAFTLTNVVNISHWRNHGDYVSQAADKEAAAHSCLGMPIR